MRLLIARLRHEERGSALMMAMFVCIAMLGLGMALLSIVDSQAKQSGTERTRDRGFNLAESALNSEAFVLGRNWPDAGVATACNGAGMGFGDALGPATNSNASAALLRNNLTASYTDAAYAGASWQVNLCDDDGTSTVWSDGLLTTRPTYDANANHKIWVRAQSIVGGKTRVVTGLVQVRQTNAFKSKYGLVAGNLSEDLSSTTSAITNASVVSGITSGILNTNPPVAEDPAYVASPPTSGVTGVRCGLLDQLTELKTCVTGTLAAVSALPVFDTLVTGGRYEQYPSTSSTSPTAIGQLRTQSKSTLNHGVYMATAPGADTAAAAPSCGISGASTDSVVFIEKVGTGDQYCVLSVGTSVTYKALVIGSGRVIIRGTNTITSYATSGTNRFTGVIYALNLQTSDQSATTPTRELVRIEQGARVKGGIHADGKNATVGIYPPPFDTDTLVCALVTCPSLLATTLKLLGVTDLVNTLVNGGCVLRVFGVCTLTLTALPVASVVTAVGSQLTNYGSAVHSDVATIELLKVYGASGVLPGTFRDLQPG
jgi:Tfp pilus assembly protein PilX